MKLIEMQSDDRPSDKRDARFESLPTEVVQHVTTFLEQNEVACNMRLVNKTMAELFKDRNIVKLSQPSPRPAFSARWAAPGSCRSLTLEQRRKLVCLTAASGDMVNLAVAVEAAGVVLDTAPLKAAARAGKVEACKWLCEPGRRPPRENWRKQVLESAAEGGHRELCEWAPASPHGPRVAWSTDAVRSAARGGHLEIMLWLLSVRPESARKPERSSLLAAAARGGSLSCLKHLLGRQGDEKALTAEEEAAEQAAEAAEEEIDLALRSVKMRLVSLCVAAPGDDWEAKAEWLYDQGIPIFPYDDDVGRMFKELADEDAIKRVDWLMDEGLKGRTAVMAAVWAGNVAAVRHLRWCRAEVPMQCIMTAAGAGKLEILKILREDGHSRMWAGPPATEALRNGHVDVFAWLLETFGAKEVGMDCPSSRLASEAARSGSCRMLSWLREKGVQFGPEVWRAVAASGCQEAVELLAEWGVPFPAAPKAAAHQAVTEALPSVDCDEEENMEGDQSEDMEVWEEEEGEQTGKGDQASVCAVASRNGDLSTLRTLKRLGLP